MYVCVYANSDDNIRRIQWDIMTQRKLSWGNNWIILGDMNDIISNKEKGGGNYRPESSFKVFRDFINENQLIDLGLRG